MNSTEHPETLVFDYLPLAVVKINRDLDFIYANPAACEWLGDDLLQKNLQDFIPVDAWSQMLEQLAKRKGGRGDFYDMQFRQRDGQYVPVQITGIPLTNSVGEHVGSVGLIRNMLFDETSESIHNAIGTTPGAAELLDKVAVAVRRMVLFDYFGVSRYSSDRQHSMSFHQYVGDDEEFAADVRWWRIPPPFRQDVNQPRVVGNFSALMDRADLAELRKHPGVEKFLARNYRSFLRLPIFAGGRLVAAVILFSRQPDCYSNHTVCTLHKLPLEQAVQMALHYHDFSEHVFRSTLLRALLSCLAPHELADLLVTELGKHNGWSHVAVFRVHDAPREFRLLAQYSPVGIALPPDYRQSLDQGVLAYVLQTGNPVNIPALDSIDYPGVAPCPVQRGLRSELCLPIMWDRFGNIRMLLNVEDEMESAFSNDELMNLEEVVRELQPALQRLSRQFVLESAFRSSPDAILVTDAAGVIREANPAALALLKCTVPTMLLGTPLTGLLADVSETESVVSSATSDAATTQLRAHDGTAVHVLVECTDVPEVLGAGHFITLRDLAPIRRLERLEAIGPFYYELAAQTATPLSLVKTWLTRLHSAAADHGDYRDLCSLAQKALLQLKHVEITHDRMQLYDDEQARRLPTHRVPLDLLVELRLLLQEFPLCETSRIDIGLAPLRVSVLADRMQVAFMFKTVFAYLLRSIPPDDQAAIRVSVDVGLCAHVRIEGVAPPDPLSADDAYAFARAQFQLTLSESLLQTFAANNSAIYHDREYVDGHVVFRIDFELAQEARP